ncbi:MAG: rhodanese-like domain-containing protein [Firmicutes bacterium]|nr:rhodanese-like domain-containing protein [Bacillota bacterium]
MTKKIKILLVVLLCAVLFAACNESLVEGEWAEYLINEHGAVLIDVREQSEFNERHAMGAINIPLGIIEENILNTVSDFQTIIILYCRTGNRSGQAKTILLNMGFERVYNMGGLNDWTGGFSSY